MGFVLLRHAVRHLAQTLTRAQREYTYRLEEHMARIKKTLGFVLAGETNRWLYLNRVERMDALVDIFDKVRREFHLDRYRFAARHVKGKCVLDCACGTGYGARVLREQGEAAFVIGIDIDDKAIAYAQKKHNVEGTAFICSSGSEMPVEDGSVDVVISFETIEHVPDDAALIEEFHRVLQPKGLLVISTPNQWPLNISPFHSREYDRDSFTDLLKSEFEVVEFYNQNSGSDWKYNHGQPRGIVAATPDNEQLGECYIAVCRKQS